MTATMRFYCPIDDCEWTHEQPMMAIPEHATEDDVRDLGKLYNSQVEDILREHYSSHSLEDWVKTVSRLKTQLDAKALLLCLGCLVDRHNAQRAGHPLPPQNPMQLVVEGNGMCLEHFQIVDGPVMPDRTASGLVLPGGPTGQIRPNGQGN